MWWRLQYADPENDEFLGLVSAIDCSGDTDLALQQFKDESDINTMVRRFGITGQPMMGTSKSPMWDDFSGVEDFQSSLNRVREAKERFDALPSDLRKHFDHDPAKLVQFVSDGRNREEAVKLGLIPAPPAPSASTVKVEDLPAS